ncbi:MAG: hypothetical protein H6988_06370 [Pseudomonadales bacterium]|nr:hypothetical protein [Halieaceae bacterium]MCP5190004.1 hypothetical protein [Pseudomonadales bacterium]MCP5205379.1 hypothetical protein [Pseudomonadales bacterium]
MCLVGGEQRVDIPRQGRLQHQITIAQVVDIEKAIGIAEDKIVPMMDHMLCVDRNAG